MRPKKRVLLLCADEQVLSWRSFLLATRGFGVVQAMTAPEALAYLASAPVYSVDLFLAEGAMPDLVELTQSARGLQPEMRVLVIGDGRSTPDGLLADGVLPRLVTAADLIERARVLTSRKPGPRPQRAAALTAQASEVA